MLLNNHNNIKLFCLHYHKDLLTYYKFIIKGKISLVFQSMEAGSRAHYIFRIEKIISGISINLKLCLRKSSFNI